MSFNSGKVGGPNVYNRNGKFTIPDAVTKTGTITSSGNRVYGTSTLFLTLEEVRIKDWIYDPTSNEVRQVVGIASDTLLYINSAFSSDIASPENLQVIRTAQYREFDILNDTGSDVTIDSATVHNNVSVPFRNEAGLDPVVGNTGGGGSKQVTIKIMK